MALTFPGASTPWRSLPAFTVTGNWAVDEQMAEAQSASDIVVNRIRLLREQAEAYAERAYVHIDKAANFRASVGTIDYVSPERVSAEFIEPEASVFDVDIDGMNVSQLAYFSPRFSVAAFNASTPAGAPQIGEIRDRVEPLPGAIMSIAAPVAPNLSKVYVPKPPVLSITRAVVSAVSAPVAPKPPDIGALPWLMPLADLHIDIPDDSQIKEALRRMRGIGGTVTLPRYDLTFQEVFEVAGSLLAGDLVVNERSIIDNVTFRANEAEDRHDDMLSRLWVDRGMDSPSDDALAGYCATMTKAADARIADDNFAQQAIWRMDALKDGYALGVAAHGMMIDILLALYELEFEAVKASAEAALELMNAASLSYRVAVTIWNANLEKHGMTYLRLRARAARHRAGLERAQALHRMNESRADIFATQERVKHIAGRLYKADVEIAEAELSAYESKMRAMAANGRALQADMESYKAEVMQWEAAAERDLSEMRRGVSRARMVIVNNQISESRAKLDGMSNEMVEAEARRIAGDVAAQAAMLRAYSAGASSRYTNARAHNSAESDKAGIAGALYGVRVAGWAADLDARIALEEGKAEEYAAASRFYVSSMESQSRAVQLEQNAKQQLAQAHRSAAEAAARAGAAIESGRLSGFRATATASVGASLGASINQRFSESEEYSSSVRETDSSSGGNK